ncbi:MAG TPA: ArsA-related P-loop ATPase [Candidatus Binataceae bacterium]|nr:ArsA-related P-loop ATPase [Candidatus Binataceae bacterium]
MIVGAGGVGKTTISAALGLAAAAAGTATVLIAADPSRRLRDALGLERLGVKPRLMDRRRLAAAGLDTDLKLASMALEAHAVWDGMLERFVAMPEARRRIRANSFYHNLTRRFAGADNAAALAQLIELRGDKRFALHVVDMPPGGQTFDLTDGPANLARLLGSDSAQWLLEAGRLSARLTVTNRLAGLVFDQITRFAGVEPLAAIAEFFAAAADGAGAIAGRMREAEALLRSSATSFVLVTTAEPERLSAASAMIADLKSAGLKLGGVILNRVADELTCAALRSQRPTSPPHLLEIELLGERAGDAAGAPNLERLADFFQEYATGCRTALLDAAHFAETLPAAVELALVPEIASTKHDLATIAALARQLVMPLYGREVLQQARHVFAEPRSGRPLGGATGDRAAPSARALRR